MNYSHIRPDPTTRRPDLPIIQNQERESMITCDYCSARNKSDDLECRKCGAPLCLSPAPVDRGIPNLFRGEPISDDFVPRFPAGSFSAEVESKANLFRAYVNAGITPSVAYKITTGWNL